MSSASVAPGPRRIWRRASCPSSPAHVMPRCPRQILAAVVVNRLYWWTPEIADLRRSCLRARRLFQRSRGRHDEETHSTNYASARRLLRVAIKTSKRRCWRQLCDEVLEAKRATYPDNIFISETLCKVPLQDLLNHTVNRLMMALNLDVADEKASLVFVLKYGFDGTNSRSYQQIAKDSAAAYSDSLFCTSLLPLQLVDKYTGIVYWSNPRPSSTRFCRPIKIAHEKETPETARNEEQDLQQQIEDLTDFKYKSCSISFEMHLTMIDGKVKMT
ncbi:unnamed protein product [Trichogramma brassicae]|uniref:Uncharacterized protein n=1 Tax=Trichogramma brassicae TaxID=86971 RepID=A0A6H5J1P8_9HYME|nr:unnamed protein product [Trichogramma brassicae]